MAKLTWDGVGERIMETGVKNGVLYLRDAAGDYPLGVAWNGLTNVTESPSGAEPTPMYADDIKYLNLLSIEEFNATIEAYTFPDAFYECDGSDTTLATGMSIGQQTRSVFGFAYKTTVVNDVDQYDHGYKIHLVYGALASPSEKAYNSINDTPEGVTFSWEVSTTPIDVVGAGKPTASVVLDSKTIDPAKLAALELLIFGDVAADAYLPLPDEIVTLINAA